MLRTDICGYKFQFGSWVGETPALRIEWLPSFCIIKTLGSKQLISLVLLFLINFQFFLNIHLLSFQYVLSLFLIFPKVSDYQKQFIGVKMFLTAVLRSFWCSRAGTSGSSRWDYSVTRSAASRPTGCLIYAIAVGKFSHRIGTRGLCGCILPGIPLSAFLTYNLSWLICWVIPEIYFGVALLLFLTN